MASDCAWHLERPLMIRRQLLHYSAGTPEFVLRVLAHSDVGLDA